ncbi:heterokaryon incompatibility protein-domain-containing protein [Chaetomium fimeti]|uniref:Heterokaryon incompatibility protein-domain-containing protein n=1 Tax=Chaetomium fimeti TaxID=1854472 RepID=A0AAE0HD90_9PEZI|nr:heterokaryon incompatibility protein-domain-containing protein [Chaetomium fimeti]
MSGSRSDGSDASCNICGHLRREPPSGRLHIARATYPTFADRATRGCILCALICNTAVTHSGAWSSVAKEKVHIDVSAMNKKLAVVGHELFSACPPDQIMRVGNSRHLFYTALYSPLESPSPVEVIPTFAHIDADPLSDVSREMVRGWLESCDKHQDCRASSIKMPPKRLVDVGGGDDAAVRITSATEDHRYLALSHCWGRGKKPLSTTKANEASMRVSIPWGALPQSFRDAIRVTRWLGARYIWIDSLCIVQDDEQDWQEESAKMAGIFSGCDLAIAATRAADCDEGFLQHRKEGQLVMSGTHQGTPLVVFARDRTAHRGLMGTVPDPFHELPLFQRGWCFQERLMAPRTLHFADDELFFQCRTENRCECSGRGAWPSSVRYFSAYYDAAVSWESRQIRASEGEQQRLLEPGSDSDGKSDTAGSLSGNNTTAFVRRLYGMSAEVTVDGEVTISFGELWGDVVSEYASLDLTFQQDVLPALSGIANLMLAYNPGRYFAGLWELDIHYLLGWSSIPSEARCYRPQNATAPSFSWASRFGPVAFPYQCIMTRVCTVLDIKCDVKGADPYGQVQGGYIVLQGKLLSGTVETRPDGFGLFRAYVTVWDARGEKHSGLIVFDTEEDEDDVGPGTKRKVYCFDLFRKREWEETDEDDSDHCGHSIVLKESGEAGSFRRVGPAECFPTAAFDSVPDVIATIL